MCRSLDVRPALGLLLAIGVAFTSAACLERKAAQDEIALPRATPTVLAATTGGVQRLAIDIRGGVFQHDVYDVQTGPTRLNITTSGGPYTLTVAPLVGPTELAADATTEIELTAPTAGEFTMQLTGAAEDTAVLNVRPLGGR